LNQYEQHILFLCPKLLQRFLPLVWLTSNLKVLLKCFFLIILFTPVPTFCRNIMY
jgi:hypothetical protein